MKTKILLLLMMLSSFVQAQISGPNSLACNQTATYSIASLAQCSQCYDWDASGNISITPSYSDMHNSVTIKAGSSSGSGTLTVTYFNETGCHTLSKAITVSCGSSSCCTPVLESYFICGGWHGGHGAVYINFTNCDRSSVSSIDWVVNGAVFNSGPLTGQSSGTTYGPGSPGNIASSCNSSFISVTATVHYNNGCPTVTVRQRILVESGPIRKNVIYPNPTKSEINIKLEALKSNNNLEIKIIDIPSGKQVYSKTVLKQDLKNEINIKGMDKYKYVKVLILDNGNVIEQSKVIIKQ